MKFYVQKEKGIVPVVSVKINDDDEYDVVAQTPNVTESEYAKVVVHIVGGPVITGNNVAAEDKAIYLVSLEKNGSYSIQKVGEAEA